MTAGRLALRRAIGHRGLRALARSMGVSPAALSMWRSGERVPNYRHRCRLEAELGIEPSAWDRRASDVEFTFVNTSGGTLSA